MKKLIGILAPIWVFVGLANAFYLDPSLWGHVFWWPGDYIDPSALTALTSTATPVAPRLLLLKAV